MINRKLHELAAITGGEFSGRDNLIQRIAVDSRSAIQPVSTLFVCIKGSNHDGHDFIDEMYQKGIRSFLVEQIPRKQKSIPDIGWVLVENPLFALQSIARAHRQKFKGTVIAITGSNGKTIVKEWAHELISARKKCFRSPLSYNSQLGVALSLLEIENQYEIALIEAGISKPGEMERLASIIQPEIMILTNIGEAHQENFRDHEEKFKEKIKLGVPARKIIFRGDGYPVDKKLKKFLDVSGKDIFTWSASGPSDLHLLSVKKENKISFVEIRHSGKNFSFEFPFTDEASIENIMHVLSVLLSIGMNPEGLLHGIKGLQPVSMRLEVIKGMNNCTIINDSYSADIISLAVALDFLNQQNQHPKKSLVISDILQTGKDDNSLFDEIAQLVHSKNISRIIGIGGNICRFQHLFKIQKSFYPTTGDFLKSINKENFRDEAILLKGARKFHFERVSLALEMKTHRTILEVNLGAIANNLNYYRKLLKPTTKIMIMVKAFSYGSGNYEIANLLQFHKVDYLAVAFADEGAELRQAGISLPILVLGTEKASIDLMINNRLEPEIYHFSILDSWIEKLSRDGIKNYPVHLKLDTGMHRLGFQKDEIDQLISKLKHQENVMVKSIFSHLSASDEKKHDTFTKNQFEIFDAYAGKIIDNLGYPMMKHILNTSGIERFAEHQHDMVRLGIGLHGISPVPNTDLREVSTLKSRILQVKEVEAGESIGYGLSGVVQEKSKIAIISIGYADGFRRSFGNGKLKVMVNGKFAPLVGNVCMDMSMINISGIDAEEGDEVVIFGEKNPVRLLADVADTNIYEILTMVSSRVPRIYIQE